MKASEGEVFAYQERLGMLEPQSCLHPSMQWALNCIFYPKTTQQNRKGTTWRGPGDYFEKVAQHLLQRGSPVNASIGASGGSRDRRSTLGVLSKTCPKKPPTSSNLSEHPSTSIPRSHRVSGSQTLLVKAFKLRELSLNHVGA